MKNRKKNFYTGLIIRFGHTLLTVGIMASAFALDTELHKKLSSLTLDSVLYIGCYTILVTLSLTFYYITCYFDPGFVPLPKKGVSRVDSDEDSDDIYDKGRMLSSGVKLRYCGFCGVEQPLRARHCEDCGRCVRCFDHHCPWLAVCIGEMNHRYFLVFLCFTLSAAIWSIYLFFASLTSSPDALTWLKSNGVTCVNLALLLPCSAVVGGLTVIHLYVALFNVTTWEFVSRSRISYLRGLREGNPFHQGYCKNLGVFLCACTEQSWEKIHESNYIQLPKEEQDEDTV